MKGLFEGSASYLYTGNVASTAADGDDISTIAAGSVAFCTEENKVEKSATTSGKLRLAQKLANGDMIFSPFFEMSTLKSKGGASYAAGTDQVTYIGYNGTSGALDATADKYFSIDTEWLNTMGVWNNTPFRFNISYQTVAASQEELATGLVTNGIATMSRQPFKFIKIDRVSDGTATALANDAIVTEDSEAVSCTAHGLSAGAYVRLAGGVYKLASVTTNAFVLDLPYQGASGTITAGTGAGQAASLASITNWGVKMTGQDNPVFDPINDNYEKTKFRIYIDTFVTAQETTTGAVDSITEVKNIARKEVYAQFLDRDPAISAYPRTKYRQEVDLTKTYDVMTVSVAEVSNVSASTGIATHKSFHITIATEVSLNGDDIDTVLGVSV